MSKYNNSLEILKEKMMVTNGNEYFFISGPFGKICLNELLEEYADNKIQ